MITGTQGENGPDAAAASETADPSAQDDGQRGNYYVGECGHRVPGGSAWHVGSGRDTDNTGLPFLRDADDDPIPFGSRVVQVAVDEEHGALPSRLHQQGQAIGRGTRLLYVRFECD